MSLLRPERQPLLESGNVPHENTRVLWDAVVQLVRGVTLFCRVILQCIFDTSFYLPSKAVMSEAVFSWSESNDLF